MKKLVMILFCATFLISNFSSCREKKEEMTEEERIFDEMQEEGADIEVETEADGDTKIKMETDEKEVKIKKDTDGDSKIKVNENN